MRHTHLNAHYPIYFSMNLVRTAHPTWFFCVFRLPFITLQIFPATHLFLWERGKLAILNDFSLSPALSQRRGSRGGISTIVGNVLFL
ncbi:hypothetical protein [Alysiella crassa]|uniref:hypothetical protein n=1 Tax=Alysiella crassa TaxID=153491 RepID=UPI00366DA26D